MTVNYSEYAELKGKFFRKHDNDYELQQGGTSAEYYHKEYVFKDGAIWYEVMTKTYEVETIEIKYCKCEVSVAMLRTEFWSSDNAESNYYYEPWDLNKK